MIEDREAIARELLAAEFRYIEHQAEFLHDAASDNLTNTERAALRAIEKALSLPISTGCDRERVIEQRLKTTRSAVSASPFYTPDQRKAVLFALDLIETGDPPSLIPPPSGGVEG